jgi:hypothetical protein
MYRDGKGVPKDNEEALKWSRKAAERGSAAAQFSLGVMYDLGQGVPKDSVQSYVWLSIAAANGRGDAQSTLGGLEKRMTPAQIEEAQGEAKRRFDKPKAFSPRD